MCVLSIILHQQYLFRFDCKHHNICTGVCVCLSVNILSFCPVILVSPLTNDMAGGLTLIETLDVGDCQLVSLCLTHSVRGDVDCISKYSIFCWTVKDM